MSVTDNVTNTSSDDNQSINQSVGRSMHEQAPYHSEMSVAALSNDRYDEPDQSINQSLHDCSSEEWLNRSLHIGSLTVPATDSMNSTMSLHHAMHRSVSQTRDHTLTASADRLISPISNHSGIISPTDMSQSINQSHFPTSNPSIRQSINQSTYQVLSPINYDLDKVDNELYDIFRMASRFEPVNQSASQSNDQAATNQSNTHFPSPDRNFDQAFASPVPQTFDRHINEPAHPPPTHHTHSAPSQPAHLGYQPVNQPPTQPAVQHTFASYPAYHVQPQHVHQPTNHQANQFYPVQGYHHPVVPPVNPPFNQPSIYQVPGYAASHHVPEHPSSHSMHQSAYQQPHSIHAQPIDQSVNHSSTRSITPTRRKSSARSVFISPQRTSPKPIVQPPPLTDLSSQSSKQPLSSSVPVSSSQPNSSAANQFYSWQGRAIVVDDEADSEPELINHNQPINQNRPRKRTNADTNPSFEHAVITKQKIEPFDIDDDNESANQSINPSLNGKLARKAELARASRKRKKMYVKNLEEQLAVAQARAAELEAQIMRNTQKVSREERMRKEQQAQIKERLMHLIKKGNAQASTQQIDPSSEEAHEPGNTQMSQSTNQPGEQSSSQLTNQPISQPSNQQPPEPAAHLTSTESAELANLVTRFVYNSRERQSLVDHYFDVVHSCLAPGLQVKFAMWGLDQRDEFYQPGRGLWSTLLADEIGLSEAQIAWIKGKRASMHQERKNLATCEAMLRETRGAIHMHLHSLHGHMDDLLSVMTPLQCAKFYLWVEANSWSMEMLNGFFDTNKKQ